MATKRSYTETERVGTMALALQRGVPHAVKVTNTPQRTIYQWLDNVGGVSEVRSFMQESELAARLGTTKAVCEAVVRGIESGEIIPLLALDAFVRIEEAKAKASPAASPVSITNVQAQQTRGEYGVNPDALAKALLTLQHAGALTNGHDPAQLT